MTELLPFDPIYDFVLSLRFDPYLSLCYGLIPSYSPTGIGPFFTYFDVDIKSAFAVKSFASLSGPD